MMMKTNLGKIVYIFSVLFLPFILNAKVVLQAPDTFYKNDVVNFKIVATGTDINIPEISNIGGNAVSTTGTSQHTTIINGSRSYKLVKGYALVGTKDIHIPSFEVKIDNKIEKTKAKIIKMLKVEKTKSDLYNLSISVDKTDVYVGEAIEFTLKFKYKKDLEIVSLDYSKPKFENFWVKELKPKDSVNNYTEYVEQEIKYLLFPQNAGKIELGSLKIAITTLKSQYGGSFYLTSPTSTIPVYSNKLELNVKSLPKDINLIGDFNIKSIIDKTTIDQGDAVSYKLYIEGRGNIDDLDEVVINIPNTTIYDNPSKKEYNIKGNIYGGKYSKIYSIVGKEDFTIPSIEVKYFDKKSATIKTIRTKKYEVKVNKTFVKEKKLEVAEIPKQNISQQIEKIKIVRTTDDEKLLYFIIGLFSGIAIFGSYIFWMNRNKEKREIPLLKNVKKAKTPDELFKILLVYINIDEELDKIIYKLEKLSLKEYKKEKTNIIKVIQELVKKDIKLDM